MTLWTIVWLIAGFAALLLIEMDEETYRPSDRFFGHIRNDIEEQPVAATIGYCCVVLGGFASFLFHFLKGKKME